MALELGAGDFQRIAAILAATFEQQKARLNELDAAIGDGDHGLSMARGFARLASFAEGIGDAGIGRLLSEGGIQFNESAGSTIGVLLLSAMREAAKAAGDSSTVGLADLARMLEAAIAGIAKRGKAQAGQKTILDSLLPALRALQEGLGPGDADEAAILRRVVEASAAGMEATRGMKSLVGRARWFAERSEGSLDPGAVSGHYIVKAFAEYCLKLIG